MSAEQAAAFDPVLLSPGGASVFRRAAPRDVLAVGTADGVWMLRRETDGEWSFLRKGLAGTFVSALAMTADGALIAGTHHFGVARSDNGGVTCPAATRPLNPPGSTRCP